MPPHYLDWDKQPIPFKIYTTLDPIKLSIDKPYANVPVLKALRYNVSTSVKEFIPELSTLAQLLFLSAGITKKKKYPGGEIHFRAAACTGALYHIDTYIVTKEIKDLEAGVYHFDPHDFSLKRLRKGDLRPVLVHATGRDDSISEAPMILICTSTFWRNSWKYQSRTYRHTFWDSGTILSNILAASSANEIPVKLVTGFVDKTVNDLLGLDITREVAVSLLTIGITENETEDREINLERLSYETMPLSREEIDYPIIRRMHEASSLDSIEEVSEWRKATIQTPINKPQGKLIPLKLEQDPLSNTASDSIGETILKRGSTRKFSRLSITFEQLSKILYFTTRGIPSDFLYSLDTTLNDIYVIVNEVDGIPKGSYYYHHDKLSLELLREGDFRRKAGHLGLGQDIPADASVNVYFLADLDNILENFGNRGYRAVELEAGILGGKLYLCAYGLGLGASGLTFFDDEVTDFFSPHAKGKSVMFLVAIGKSGSKKLSFTGA